LNRAVRSAGRLSPRGENSGNSQRNGTEHGANGRKSEQRQTTTQVHEREQRENVGDNLKSSTTKQNRNRSNTSAIFAAPPCFRRDPR
jgi:hypothetical protein